MFTCTLKNLEHVLKKGINNIYFSIITLVQCRIAAEITIGLNIYRKTTWFVNRRIINPAEQSIALALEFVKNLDLVVLNPNRCGRGGVGIHPFV